VTGLSRRQLRLRLVGIGAGLLGWVSYRALAAVPEVAERVAGAGPVPFFMRSLSLASGAIPIALAEVVIAGFLLRQGIGAWRGLSELRRKDARAAPLFARGALRFAQDAGIAVFLFYLLWGFQYARPGLEVQLGIAAAGEVETSELRALTERAVAATNGAYRALHGTDDLGRPTPASTLAELSTGLDTGWERTWDDLGIADRVTARRGDPKAFLSSPLVKRLGISGMYFPFTGEALVLRDLPGILQGKDMGHEMAHQRGFASESDANVLGALVAARSPDLLTRYSAYSFIERQLLAALQRASSRDAREVARGRSPGVRRDLEDLSEYWEPARTRVATAATRVNDRMLRTHGVREGVGSYAGSTWVFVALARTLGPEALFGS
jgi:hypothetical protein